MLKQMFVGRLAEVAPPELATVTRSNGLLMKVAGGSTHDIWLALGLVGQACLAARFLVQWMASERQRRSVMPASFWYLSLAGGVAVLTYAIHRRDPVFVVGQAAGLGVYARNMHLNHGPGGCRVRRRIPAGVQGVARRSDAGAELRIGVRRSRPVDSL